VTLDKVISLMKYDRDFELTINWKNTAKVNFKHIDNPNFHKVNLNAPSLKESQGKNISIYDCLSTFG
jgi:hypothetical protein